MSSQQETALARIPGWKAYAPKLAANWITTAEQVVGMASGPQGVRTLADHLDVSEAKMRGLIAAARAALPAAVAAELGKEVDTSQYGLGAIPPDAQPSPRRPRGKSANGQEGDA